MVVTRLCRDPKRADLYKQIDKQVKKMYLYLSSASFSRECESCNCCAQNSEKKMTETKQVAMGLQSNRVVDRFRACLRLVCWAILRELLDESSTILRFIHFLNSFFVGGISSSFFNSRFYRYTFRGNFRKRRLGQTRGILRPPVRRSSAGRRGGWRWIWAAPVAATATTSGTACFQADHSVQMTKSEIIFHQRSIS